MKKFLSAAALSAWLVFAIGCFTACKKQIETLSAQVSQPKTADFTRLKHVFDSANYQNKMTQKLSPSTFLQWEPDWANGFTKGGLDGSTFYYVPLIGHEYDDDHKQTSRTVSPHGFRKFVLVQKSDSAIDFTWATFFNSGFGDDQTKDSALFSRFNGTMSLISLSSNRFYKYDYVNGRNLRKNTQVDHYEYACVTEYHCTWTADCYYTVYVMEITGPDCSSMPGPLSDQACHTSGNEGDTNWYLSDAKAVQNCGQVWVDDVPPPTSGSTGTAPGQKLCRTSFNYIASTTHSHYLTTMTGMQIESGPTQINPIGKVVFSLADGITAAAASKVPNPDYIGSNADCVQYLNAYFPDLWKSGDIGRKMDLYHRTWTLIISPKAAQIISAFSANLASAGVIAELGPSASNPTNTLARTEFVKQANEIIRCFLPGSTISAGYNTGGTSSSASYALNCQ